MTRVLVVEDEESFSDALSYMLRKEGFDAEGFWKRLKNLGPTEIIEIKGDEGEHIKIWLE